MPTFRVELPDGRIARIDAASGDAALAFAKTMKPKVQEDAERRVKNTPDQIRSVASGATLGAADQLDALGAGAETGIHNLFNKVTGKPGVGYGMGDAYDAVLKANHASERDYRKTNPVSSTALEIGGGLLTPLGMLGRFVKGGAEAGLLGRTARGVAAGGLLGGVAGGLSADPGKIGQGVKSGATIGAVTGGALPLAGEAVGTVGKSAARLANRATGGRLLDPAQEAGTRLAESLRKDGLSPDQIKTAMNAWLKTGASSPALLDLAGPNTQRLLRAAAGKGGPANTAAVKYNDEIAGNLQDRAINRAQKLTPDTRAAGAVADDLAAKQSTLANEQYKPAYAQTVKLDPAAKLALSGKPGQAVIDKAVSAIQERAPSDPDVAQQLVDLARLRGGVMDEPVSAATLDTLRINMGERGRKLMEKGAKYQAGGSFGRQGMIDQSLDQIPELQPARQTFKGVQAQRDALDLGKENAFQNPDEYGAELQRLIGKATQGENPYPVSAEDIQGAAGVGLRSDIVRNMGAPTQGATGYLNRLSTGQNPSRVLGDTFGPEEAQRFQEGIGNEVSRMRNARFIDPGNGSQTALRVEDSGLVDVPHPSPAGLARFALTKVLQGITLTDEERHALVQLGTSGAGDALDKIDFSRIAPQSQRALPLAGILAERAQ
jgi:hypothetical protein